LISGFDEKVADTITEWKSDARRSKITIRQLLSLTSGIDAGEILAVPTYADSILKPAIYEPGTHFEYGPVPFQIFGELMTRKLRSKNETVMKYLHRRILDPIGLDVAYWRTFDGQPLLPQGANLKAREWIKFGQLLKNRGKWNGKQIIDTKLLDELVVGSKVNPAYGLTFWLNAVGIGPSGVEKKDLSSGNGAGKPAGADVYMAAGAGNQRLYVVPSHDLVIVRFGAFGGYEDREFLSKLLTGK
jgi:CubicO group peptidase (beta-lactamase class C family)